MRDNLLLTKIIPPLISSNALYRSRLLDHLRSNLNKRLISICADAGYGKTTLLAQLLGKLDLPHLWYQIDKTDQDFSIFLCYLIEGIRKYHAEFGKRTISVLTHSRGREVKIEILLGTLINELIELPEPRILLIFDDFHEIYRARKIIAGFEYLLNHMPTHISIIIASRTNPPFSLERLRFKNELLEIDQHDLKFNRAEIKLLCKKLGGFSPSPDEVERLEADSEGWITCLQFLVRPSTKDHGSLKGRSLIERLYEYFEKEVFSSLDENIKSFLTATSIFEHLTPEACNFILAIDDSDTILRDLGKKHLFISSYETVQPSYGYHHFFRDFLLQRLKAGGDYDRFHNKAGHFFEKKKIWTAAIRHYCEARDYHSVARLLERYGEEDVALGKVEFVRQYLNRLPPRFFDRSPILTRIQGNIAIWDCNWDQAGNFYAKSKRIAQRQKSDLEFYKAWHMQLSRRLNLGKSKGIIKEIRKILRSKRLRNRKLRARYLNLLGIALSYERRSKAAIAVFEECLKEARKTGDDAQINVAINNLATVNSDSGNFPWAKDYFESLINRLLNNPSPLLVPALYNLGALFKDHGDLQKARECSEQGMKYAKLFNDRNMICMNLINLALVSICQEELEKAGYSLNQAERIAVEIGHAYRLSHILNTRAELAIRRGDLFAAREFSRKALDLPVPLMSKAGFMITRAQVEISLGNFNRARKILTQAISYTKEATHLLMTAYFQMARLYFLQKNPVRADYFITRSLILAEQNSYDFLFLYELKNYPEMTKFIRGAKPKSSYLQHLFLKFQDTKTTYVLTEPDLKEFNFVIRLFDVVEIFKDGQEIRNSAWRTKRFQEAFVFLATNCRQAISREKIIDIFWPEHRPGSAKQLFYNTLYWIRKVVGDDVIIFERGVYKLSPRLKYWIDTHEFENLAAQGDELLKERRRVAGLLKYEEALALYRGEFMNDFYSEWCQQKRRYFEGLYLYLLKKLSDGHYQLGNYDKALQLSNRYIVKDPFYEEAYCRSMRCYAALNDLRGINDCYQRLTTVLSRELKTTPRAETTNLFQTLMKRQRD